MNNLDLTPEEQVVLAEYRRQVKEVLAMGLGPIYAYVTPLPAALEAKLRARERAWLDKEQA